MVAPCTKRDEKKNSADLYSTPKEALDAIKPYLLSDIDKVDGKEIRLLEPCAGIGSISDYLIDMAENYYLDNNKIVIVEDNELYKYNYPTCYRNNFLAEDNGIPSYFDIAVVNPPYNKAVDFVLKGFEHAPIQWHFLRLSFLEGQERYNKLMSLGKLTDVYIFTYRVSCPKGVDREPSANSVAYCWMRWDNNYQGNPKLHWLIK